MDIIKQIPQDLINFSLVVLFSLLIGLEQRSHHHDEKIESLFGTDRTFTLIGILGFILYIISPDSLNPFLAGGLILSSLLGIFYFHKIKLQSNFGITSIVIALITYCLAPLLYLEPPWLVMLILVCILIVVEIKEDLFNLSKRFSRAEFTTLAKFIIIAGVILPLLPHRPILTQLSISPYQIWLAIVVVSAISYFSYLLKKFIYPNSGTILAAILGGMYSSTATTVILAKRSNEGMNPAKISAGIIAATAMMYIRILLLASIFNSSVAISLLPSFLVLFLVSSGTGFLFLRARRSVEEKKYNIVGHQNPLEFKTAILFGMLFAFFAVLTNIVIRNYGSLGVNILSLVVGVADIDPYILNLFQTDHIGISSRTIVHATIIATASNNLMKMVFSLVLGDSSIKHRIVQGFSALILVSAFLVFLL